MRPSQPAMPPAARPMQRPQYPGPAPYGAGPPVQVPGPSSSYGPGVPGVVEQFGTMVVSGPGARNPLPPQDPPVPRYEQQQQTPPPLSSKGVRFPLRPGQGRTGQRCIVKANHFFAELPDKDLHQYDVS